MRHRPSSCYWGFWNLVWWIGCLTWNVNALQGISAETHWSFRSVSTPSVPRVRGSERVRSAIDAFVQAKLEAAGIDPSPEVDRTTLIRRVTIDLLGLPPTPEEVDRFLQDDRPGSYERLVERLLASPHYGERWTRVWLDLCHYGDSDGHLTDQLRPVAWRYRDWVMRALNENLPFDQFTIAQVAGDLLNAHSSHAPGEGSSSKTVDPISAQTPTAASDAILGTGFLRQTLSNREGGADLEEYRVEQIVDRASLVSTIWLGLTLGCARCHDHKYDPLTQEEFFRIYAYFDRADEVNIDAPLPMEHEAYVRSHSEYRRQRQHAIEPFRTGLKELQQLWERKCLQAAAQPGQDHIWDRQWELLGLVWGGGQGEGQLEGTEIVKLAWEKRTARQHDDLLDYFLLHGSIADEKRFAELKLKDLQNQLTALKKQYPAAQPTRAPVMQAALTARRTHLHERGDFRSPGPQVEPGRPRWLLPDETATSNPETRLTLARWLVSRNHPLTARVTVNRMWQEFFGQGLVATSNDFGVRGDAPSHPDLLDWLAQEFMRCNWDVKQMHRMIVTSATYRQSSRPRPELVVRDPNNGLLARQASLRVPAETVRDLALAASGLLNTRLGGPSVFPPQNERVTMEAFGSNSWKTSEGGDRYRRGVYTFILRTSPFAQAIIFDAPNPQLACTRRDRSNTPLQALTLLNDPAFLDLAEALALRIQREGGIEDVDRIQFAWRSCLGRSATEAETTRLIEYLAHQRRGRDTSGQPLADHAEWTSLASVLFNLHEFITRD